MKYIFITLVFLVVYTTNILAQQEVALTKLDVDAFQRERNIIEFLGIRMSKHQVLELVDGELSGRTADIMDVFYAKSGNPAYLMFFDEKGKREKYYVFQYDENNNKVEEIRFNADSTILNGILYKYDHHNRIVKQLNYNDKGKILSTNEYIRKGDTLILRETFNNNEKIIARRSYNYIPPLSNGQIASIITYDNHNVLLDSTVFYYNKKGLAENKRVYTVNSIDIISISYVYNSDGALVEYIETKSGKSLTTSIEHDEFGNIIAIITSDEDSKIIEYHKISHYNLTNKPLSQ